MSESFQTPSIAVTIGRVSRVFHLYVTQAPAALDAPFDNHPAHSAVR